MMSEILIRKANIPIIDKDGMSTGKLVGVKYGTGKRIEKIGREREETEYARVEFKFEIQSTGDYPLEITLFTGMVINHEPIKTLYKTRSKKNMIVIYNRFTTMCLKIGLIKESDLYDCNDKKLLDIQNKLLGIKDQHCKFKVGRDKNSGYLTIDINSLETINNVLVNKSL